MQKAVNHPYEDERVSILQERGLTKIENNSAFNAITEKAAKKLNIKIVVVSIVDVDSEIYISAVGESRECGPRDISFCGHALLAEDVFICENTLLDDRFKDNPYVINSPYIRFYAGMRLLDHKTGLPLGVFCVKDTRPRKFSLEELATFLEFAARVEALLQSPGCAKDAQLCINSTTSPS